MNGRRGGLRQQGDTAKAARRAGVVLAVLAGVTYLLVSIHVAHLGLLVIYAIDALVMLAVCVRFWLQDRRFPWLPAGSVMALVLLTVGFLAPPWRWISLVYGCAVVIGVVVRHWLRSRNRQQRSAAQG
jgi:hypothetical protein